jgi:dihydroorotate dehydrogenase electron transfer subunit
MHSPLHAAHFADRAVQRTVSVTENVRLARDTYRMRFDCAEIAHRIHPGQFLMLRLADCNDPLLGRPLALYDTILATDGEPQGIDVVYLVKGKFTSRLATCLPGQPLDVWGPLGNGFPIPATEHLIMAAGGIGQTPFLTLAQEYLGLRSFGDPPRDAPRAQKVTLCYGARSADLLAGVDDFARLGVDMRLCTEDGSRGQRGLVTDALRQVLAESPLPRRIVCCGPETMLEAVARLAAATSTPCQVSLETPMACGIGICFTCVAKVKQPGGQWDYKRTCVEGPVFDAAEIAW